MTDDIKLLPMPKGEAVGMYQAWSYDQMQAYARANVLHHTATLQAEIEALRAEVARLSEALREWWSAHRPVGWTEDQHRACPHVNLATATDRALAEHVATAIMTNAELEK